MTVKRHVVVKRKDHRIDFRSLGDKKADIDYLFWALDEAQPFSVSFQFRKRFVP